MNPRTKNIEIHFDSLAKSRDSWIQKNNFFYSNDYVFMRSLINEGQRILELGCGTGQLLNVLKPSYGVGVDLSYRNVEVARKNFPELVFIKGDMEESDFIGSLDGPFDFIILSDTIGYLNDCEIFFNNLHKLCNPSTRLIIANYSWFWEPFLKVGEKLSLKMPTLDMNWLTVEDTRGFLHLADFETVKHERRQLIPFSFFGLSDFFNKFFGTLPGFCRLSLRSYLVARPTRDIEMVNPSSTVLIPCRNEMGNIENAIKRLPDFCEDLEILFVEGNSQDGTLDEIHRVIKSYPDKDIKVLVQDGKGKGDAVRKGFNHARGDILMILDADLTVPPEDLPKFYKAISSGKGEYINGTRLVYPMDALAMRFLNFWANRTFSVLFTWILNQRLTDTLCGTKVLTKKNYEQIAANRSYFGDFDPFGDFDLIFGASKHNLKIVEIPVRYAAREYGETQISRFRHGWLLLKMVIFAYKKFKLI